MHRRFSVYPFIVLLSRVLRNDGLSSNTRLNYIHEETVAAMPYLLPEQYLCTAEPGEVVSD